MKPYSLRQPTCLAAAAVVCLGLTACDAAAADSQLEAGTETLLVATADHNPLQAALDLVGELTELHGGPWLLSDGSPFDPTAISAFQRQQTCGSGKLEYGMTLNGPPVEDVHNAVKAAEQQAAPEGFSVTALRKRLQGENPMVSQTLSHADGTRIFYLPGQAGSTITVSTACLDYSAVSQFLH